MKVLQNVLLGVLITCTIPETSDVDFVNSSISEAGNLEYNVTYREESGLVHSYSNYKMCMFTCKRHDILIKKGNVASIECENK